MLSPNAQDSLNDRESSSNTDESPIKPLETNT